jgi:hypothetical protein
MNPYNENEKPKETRETRTQAPPPKPFEAEPLASSEAADFRETVEGGYGWGV